MSPTTKSVNHAKVTPDSYPASTSFASFFSLAFSATVACVREIIEFLTDFQLGTNLMKMDVADDSHWFYRLFGKGMTELIPNQQRILDTDEDMLLAVLSAFVAAGVLYIYLRIKNKSLFINRKTVSFIFPTSLSAPVIRKEYLL